MTIPVISLSLFDRDIPVFVREQAIQELDKACREVGFFYLVDHGVPQATLDAILSTARTFFLESSDEEKAAIQRKDPPHGDGAHGYQKLGEEITLGKKDWHEGLDFYKEWHDRLDQNGMVKGMEDGLLKAPNLFPRRSPNLNMKDQVHDYVRHVLRIGTQLIHASSLALTLTPTDRTTLLHSTRDSFWNLRLLGYPPLTGAMASQGVSCGEHTDYGCLTLLLQDATRGALQVWLKSGEWIDADPLPGAFVVNIGDMLERWTNGEWVSTRHRVLHRGERFRVSVPFFFEPNFDAVVGPLGTCVRRCGERRYRSTVYGQHLVGKIRGNYEHDE